MDIIDESRALIKEKLAELEVPEGDDNGHECETSTQAILDDCCSSDQDKNLNKILNQQAYLKRIIDEDNNIQILKSSLDRVALEIEGLRRSCTKENEDALKARQELVQTQAKEIEKYQMNQIRSISDDYKRHQEILEQRKKEIVGLQKEIEREEKERATYLIDVEKKLERQLQDRQRAIRGGALPFASNIDDEVRDPNYIELTSVQEYAPYGAAPHSRLPPTNARGARAGARGRGGRRRGKS